ncbi:MAG: ribonuclease H-like domain-containing protein, partial [Treponema sp.]|nr:ribonuclease H-like domain-containing protein [Treponema sp.]
MRGNLRNRLLLMREMEGRKNAAKSAAVSGEAAVTDTREKAASPPQPEKEAPLSGVPSPSLPSASMPSASMPGWENAGFLTARRTVILDFPHTLPPVFPRGLGITAPDFFGYFSAAGGKAGPESLRFFDLETTGLSSGAGTVAFLAAFGRFVPAAAGGMDGRYALRVNQYLLLDYPGENDFLEAALKEFARDWTETEETARPPLIVTYNGKTFDAQILKTRCLMNAIVPPDYCHADLLHPARRLWKRVLP